MDTNRTLSHICSLSKKALLLAVLFPGLSFQGSCQPALSRARPVAIAESGTVSARAGTEGDFELAPLSAYMEVLPFLAASEPFSISILNAGGSPCARAAVVLDGQTFVSDAKGQVKLLPPQGESFELAILSEGKKKIARRKFKKVADNLFCEEGRNPELAAALFALKDDSNQAAPSLSYAPPVISPGGQFLLFGDKFSETLSDNYVEIDGLNAPVLAASPRVLLALAPIRLSLGPLREIRVGVSGKSTNVFEVDLAKPFFDHVKVDNEEGSPEKGKIGMSGTSIPCLIKVSNLSPETASLWSPKQEPLGKNNLLLSPGGNQNYLEIDLRKLSEKAQSDIKLELLQEASADLEGSASQMMLAANKALVSFLQQEKMKVEERLELSRKRPSGSSAPAPAESAKVTGDSASLQFENEYRALSVRLGRINKMMLCRKTVLQSMGVTDAQWRSLVDEASSSTQLSLYLSVHPVQILSDGGVGSSAGSSARYGQAETAIRKTKARSLRLLTPVIRLLPPMSELELAAFREMKNRDSFSDNSSPELDASSGQDPDSQTPRLRPSMPEPEPQPSQESRNQNLDRSLTKDKSESPAPTTAPKKNANEAKGKTASNEKKSGSQDKRKSGSQASKSKAKTPSSPPAKSWRKTRGRKSRR